MNSNFGKSTSSQRGGSASLSSFDFDLGLSSNQPRSLNDQKHPSSSFSSAQTRPIASAKTPSWQPNKPSWTHQPAPRPAASGLPNATTPMVGDIMGKSWSSAPPSSPAPRVGIVSKDPKLFGDLLNSALGQGKNNSNVPLKNAPRASPQATSKNSNSTGNLADLLSKTGNPVKGNINSGSSDWFGSFRGSTNANNVSIGGRSTAGFGGSGAEKDPFGSLVDFGSKEAGSLNNPTKSHKFNTADNKFGDFQNPSNPTANRTNRAADDFSFMESSSTPNLKIDDFGIPAKDYASQRQSPHGDPLSMFNSPLNSGKVAPSAAQGAGDRRFSEIDDWGLDLGLGGGGGSDLDTNTELDELPPPPGGVSATAAMKKGMDSQKQGQYADSIKWLSWAVILLEKGGDVTPMVEVLSCRASCYKEVGEYKKAVADCTKVLEHDGKNVVVLVQRALLYESMEKYKLGAEDLRAVMKLDPGNRVARSTIHRLTKMSG